MKNNINIRLQVKVFGLLLAVCLIVTGCRGCRTLFGKDHKNPENVSSTPIVDIEPTVDPNVNRGGGDTGGRIGDGGTDRLPGDRPPDRRPPSQLPTEEAALKTAHFDYDSSVLTPKTQETLLENVAWLRANPRVPVIIEGHCDERGTVEYNLALGDRRAKKVKEFLIVNGINPERVYVISYGKERPVDPGHGEVHWWKNRRAEFKRYR